MKNFLLVLVAALALAGCDGKQKDELVEQLQLKFKNDSDLADYKIAPEDMADCVADKILKEIPGLPGSPNRKRTIEAYTKLVRVNQNEDFRPALEATKEVFGSTTKALEAAGNITTSSFSCIGDLVNGQPLEADQK
ncbi:MAG: hypothetical protein ACU843_08205 [Gammaproteobacteria bacterium]